MMAAGADHDPVRLMWGIRGGGGVLVVHGWISTALPSQCYILQAILSLSLSFPICAVDCRYQRSVLTVCMTVCG